MRSQQLIVFLYYDAGRPHVMSCSLFGQGKKRWVHRFTESIEASQLACLSAGHSLVALGE